MIMPATTTVTAALAALEIRRGRHAPELKCFADVLVNGLMHRVHFFLRFQKPSRDRIAQKSLTLFFKLGNLFPGQLLRTLLFLLQRLPFGHQSFVLRPGLLVGDKSFNSLPGRPHLRLVQNRLAKFPGFFSYDAVFNSLHIRC